MTVFLNKKKSFRIFSIVLITIFSLFTTKTLSAQEENEEEIWTIVETMPVFTKECASKKTSDAQQQCTMLSIQQYVMQVDYPSGAIEKLIEGKVYISFTVDSLATIVDVEIFKTSGFEILDKTALEYIKNMPSFYSPAMVKDKAVSVKYRIPVAFNLGLKKKKRKKNGIKKTK